jgi:hypothetical protein
MKAKLLTLAGVCALAVALAVPASGAAVTVQPFHGGESGPSQICGVDINSDFSFTGVTVVKASGVSLGPNEFRAVWTNLATGKSIVIQGANLGASGPPIDNGDGTVSFIGSSSGNYIVKDAHGAPISLDSGRVVARVTFDAATGAFISVESFSISGNETDTPADSSCGTIVQALT